MDDKNEELIIDFLVTLNSYLVIMDAYVENYMDKKEIFHLSIILESIKIKLANLKKYYEFIDI